jgi:hypothetical protein
VIREHGCMDYSTLFLESGEVRDICEMAEHEDWEEDGDMMRC